MTNQKLSLTLIAALSLSIALPAFAEETAQPEQTPEQSGVNQEIHEKNKEIRQDRQELRKDRQERRALRRERRQERREKRRERRAARRAAH